MHWFARELEGLPAPVQRYFRAVLTDGQPIIARVTVELAGAFNMSAAGERRKATFVVADINHSEKARTARASYSRSRGRRLSGAQSAAVAKLSTSDLSTESC